MDTYRNIIAQELIESQYSRKHIDKKIKDSILNNPDMLEKISQGVDLINTYINGEYYPKKAARIEQLKSMDIEAMVLDMYIGIAYSLKPELFTSVTAKLAARLGFNDKADAIATTAEMVAILCETDAFDIDKPDIRSSMYVVSRIPLEEKLIEYINHSEVLPPMVCKPLEVTHNYSSGYLTHNDSLILGSGNHHDKCISLDVLNIMNGVALSLDYEFLDILPETPTYVLETQQQFDNWTVFVKQSKEFYKLMLINGNRFYLTHKVDKRGRIYASGYHITTQGTSYKKAMLELADKELVEGI